VSRAQDPASANATDLSPARGGVRRRVLSRLAPAVAGLGVAVVLVGCSAGQITQTDTQQSAVNGASGQVGAIAVRNAELMYPANTQGVYPRGSSASLIVTIANTGILDDELLSVSSPAATSVTIDGSPTGTRPLPGNFSISSGVDLDDATGAVVVPTTAPTTSPAVASGTPGTETSGASTSTTGTSTAGKHGSPSGTNTTTPTTTTAAPLSPGAVRIVLSGIRTINGQSLRAGLTIPITFTFARAGQVTLQEVPIAAPPDALRLDTPSANPVNNS
jgi:copper(I)-binding protein